MLIEKVSFLKSASKVQECPNDGKNEVAVIGRSNVGKSSLINMLMQQNIAKASDKPGKTQLINYFLVNESWYLVDLPGYGYAKSALEERRKWIDVTHDYFLSHNPHILVLVDGSIPPQKIDLSFMESLEEEGLNFDIVVTKIDKANQKTVSQNLKLLRKEIEKTTISTPNIILSSSVKKTGRDQILSLLEEHLRLHQDCCL